MLKKVLLCAFAALALAAAISAEIPTPPCTPNCAVSVNVAR